MRFRMYKYRRESCQGSGNRAYIRVRVQGSGNGNRTRGTKMRSKMET